jgi:hypothetical protein
MKKNILIILLSVVVVVAVIIFVAVLLSKETSITVATYGLSETETAVIKELCTKKIPENYTLKFIALNGNKSLHDEIIANKKIDVVFSENGLALEKAKYLFKKFDVELFQKLPSVFLNAGNWTNIAYVDKPANNESASEWNVQNARLKDANLYAYPIYFTVPELLVKKRFYPLAERTSFTSKESIDEMLKTLKTKFPYPLVLQGSKDEVLSFLVSALLTEYGVDYTSDDFIALQKEIDFHKHLPNELRQVLQTLVSWKMSGFLHTQWYDLTDTDLQTFLEFDQSPVAFLTVDAQMKMNRDLMENYIQKNVLLTTSLAASNIPARMIFISQVEKKQNAKLADISNAILSYFQSVDAQKEIFAKLNFPAVEYNANVTFAASTAAGWIYAANSIIPTIDKILFETVAQRKKFIDEIRNYIGQNGFGYNE